MKIGSVEIKNAVFIAPMAGVSNYAYRKIMKELGAGLIYAEMISDKAIYFNNGKTLEMAKVSEDERPISMQIFGGDIDTLLYAAKFLDKKTNCDIIDINFGCPVNKVAVKSKAGSALLKEPKLVKQICETIVKQVSKPVTIKIRIGWDENLINAVEIAKIAEQAGIAAVAVHGRTKKQMYSGQANWNIIKDVKQAVKIPVIGNGDIFSPEDAKKMMDDTGVDAVMLARGVRNYPFLAKQCVEYLNTGKYNEPSIQEIFDIIHRHSKYLWDLKGEVGMKEMRGHIAHYLRGIPNSKKIKVSLNKINTLDDVELFLNKFKEI